MADTEAEYRGVHIIVNTSEQPDGTWQAVFTLHEDDVTTTFTVDPLQGVSEEAVIDAAIDEAQREIDKTILMRGFVEDQKAELESRRKPD